MRELYSEIEKDVTKERTGKEAESLDLNVRSAHSCLINCRLKDYMSCCHLLSYTGSVCDMCLTLKDLWVSPPAESHFNPGLYKFCD